MPFKAVFFDFDGLIIDTETPELEAWGEIFTEQQVVLPEQYWLDAVGRGADQLLEKPIDVLGRLVDHPLDLVSVEAEYKKRVSARIHFQPIRPGIVELAKEARDRGIPVYVVSSSGHDWVDGHLKRLGIFDLFDRTVCREDAEHAKPFPDLYLKAAQLTGVFADETIVFEDSPNGVLAAKGAGMYVVAAPNPLTARLDLSRADVVVTSLGGMTLDEFERNRIPRENLPIENLPAQGLPVDPVQVDVPEEQIPIHQLRAE